MRLSARDTDYSLVLESLDLGRERLVRFLISILEQVLCVIQT